MTRLVPVLGLLLLSPQLSWAAPKTEPVEPKRLPRPADFVYLQQLQIDGEHSAYQLVLPENVYRQVAPDQLQRISVFNQSGQLVPSRIQTPQPQVEKRQEVISLGFYNGFQQKSVAPSPQQLAVYQGNDTLRINLELAPQFGQPPANLLATQPTPNTYYIDLRKVPQSQDLRRLDFQWDETGADNFTFDVDVSGTQDFQTWAPLGQARLVNLRQGESQLQLSQVHINPPSQNFLRIRFSSGEAVPTLKALVGMVETQRVVTPSEVSLSVSLEALDQEPGYVFDTGGDFPLHQLHIKAAQENSLGEVQVSYFKGGQWRPLAHATLAEWQQKGPQFSEPGIDLLRHRERRWKLLFSRDSINYLQHVPDVTITYTPERLAFVRQGEAPFILAYGVESSRLASLEWPDWRYHGGFPDESRQSEAVSLGALREQKPEAWELPSTSPLSTPKVLFWLGLSLFVLAMLYMAVHLLKELKQPKKDD